MNKKVFLDTVIQMGDKLNEESVLERPLQASRRASVILDTDSPILWNSTGGMNFILPKVFVMQNHK